MSGSPKQWQSVQALDRANMDLDWTNAEWADGPTLIAWLQEKQISPCMWGDRFCRRATDWRKGSPAKFDTVDELLTRAGWHVWELPNAVWREPPLRAGAALARRRWDKAAA